MEQVSERSCGCTEFQQGKKSVPFYENFCIRKMPELYQGILKASDNLLHNHYVLSETWIWCLWEEQNINTLKSHQNYLLQDAVTNKISTYSN